MSVATEAPIVVSGHYPVWTSPAKGPCEFITEDAACGNAGAWAINRENLCGEHFASELPKALKASVLLGAIRREPVD